MCSLETHQQQGNSKEKRHYYDEAKFPTTLQTESRDEPSHAAVPCS